MKRQAKTALYVLAAITFIDVIKGCTVDRRSFRPLTTLQLMERFDVMVYGKYMGAQWDFNSRKRIGNFRVECTLKNDNPENQIPSDIKIKNPFPVLTCSHNFITPGTSYLAGLTRRENGLFEFEYFLLQSSALEPTDDNLRLAASIACGMNPIQMPMGMSLTDSPACKKMIDIAGSAAERSCPPSWKNF